MELIGEIVMNFDVMKDIDNLTSKEDRNIFKNHFLELVS